MGILFLVFGIYKTVSRKVDPKQKYINYPFYGYDKDGNAIK